jgi:integrase
VVFAEFAKEWVENVAALKKAATHADYERTVRRHLVPFFGELYIRDIDTQRVQQYVTARIKEGLEARNINKTVTTLHLMFQSAIVWGYSEDNPTKLVSRPREKKKEMDYLNPEEVRRLLVASQELPLVYFPLFATAVFSGARLGELLALRWADIDLEQGLVFIRRSYSSEYGVSEPKTAQSRRAVHISPKLISILRAYKADSSFMLVFPNRNGQPLSRQNILQRYLHRACDSAGLRHIRFHDLRHTYSALMIAAGENMKFIQRQLGHSSIRTTMDTYGHLLPEASEGVGRKLDALVWDVKVVPIEGQTQDYPKPYPK